MALSASTIWEVQTGGSDTLNGGAFDPSKVAAGGFTDGAATVANTSAPVFTSASYNFVAGDVGAKVYINSGTNWIPGWYNIVSVAANAATLNAAIGQAFLATKLISTVVGCATVASPTGATWSIDYSQQAALKSAYTDLVSAGTGLTVSSAGVPFGRQQVGNALVITGGTNFNLGRYVIASVAAVTFIATVVGPTNITTGAGVAGAGGLGGALKTPGQSGAAFVSGNSFYWKSGTYSITSASTNVANGCFSATVLVYVEGYQTTRGDFSNTKPTLEASGISTATLVAFSGTGSSVRNLKLDGKSLTSIRGINFSVGGNLYKIFSQNCTNSGIVVSGGTTCTLCVTTLCGSGAVAFIGGLSLIQCESYLNSNVGFLPSTNATLVDCISASNSGAASDGFLSNNLGISYINCTAYGNGRAGFRITAASNTIINGISQGNSEFGYYLNGQLNCVLLNCGAYNNTSGATDETNTTPLLKRNFINATSTFFTDAGGLDFSLNNVATGGALARAAGIPGPFQDLTTTGYLDLGAVQHQDSGGSGGGLATAIFGG